MCNSIDSPNATRMTGARVASAINDDDEDQPWENLARSNIRVWVDGDGIPDAACAVVVAEDLG